MLSIFTLFIKAIYWYLKCANSQAKIVSKREENYKRKIPVTDVKD